MGVCRGTTCGCAGVQQGTRHGRSVWLGRGAVCGCVEAQHWTVQGRVAVQGCSRGLRKGTKWGCARVRQGIAQGRNVWLLRGTMCGCEGAQCGTAQRRGLGPCKGVAGDGARAQRVATKGRCMAPQWRMGLRRGAAWDDARAQCGTAPGRRWDCARVQCGAAQACSVRYAGRKDTSPHALGVLVLPPTPHQEVICVQWVLRVGCKARVDTSR